ncbi:MAG: SpoIIE family protein phosphatase [Bacteroidota bacterium]
MTNSKSAAIKEDWQSEMKRIATKHHIIVCWVAIILNPIWFISDYFTIPNYWQIFLIVRLAVTAIILLAVLLRKTIHLSTELLLVFPFLGISIQNAYMWSVMDVPTLQKHAFAYLALIIGAGMLVLWKPIWTIAMVVLSIIANVIYFQLNSQLSTEEILINGGLLVLTVGIISVVLIHSRYILTKKEIIARLALAATNEELELQKGLIEKKNKEITDSINYAQRIQQAILPNLDDISTAFPASFVLYKPKDIVSGDFYFYTKNEENHFIAAADCTGHGVPGAFMSMIGAEKLGDSVAQSTNPSSILKSLNEGIKTSLKQFEENGESTRDGMDLAFCAVDTKSKLINYAGANRPFWLIRKHSNVLEEIKATKKAIGGFTEYAQEFENHTIQINDGDTFYLCTDGFADTFNGETDKKMNTKRFKELLLSIQHLSMKEQEKYLTNFIQQWQGVAEQVDDILVIGIRL